MKVAGRWVDGPRLPLKLNLPPGTGLNPTGMDLFIRQDKMRSQPIIPSGNLLHSYWKWPFIVDFPVKNGGSFHSYVSLPEGTRGYIRCFDPSQWLCKNMKPPWFTRMDTLRQSNMGKSASYTHTKPPFGKIPFEHGLTTGLSKVVLLSGYPSGACNVWSSLRVRSSMCRAMERWLAVSLSVVMWTAPAAYLLEAGDYAQNKKLTLSRSRLPNMTL